MLQKLLIIFIFKLWQILAIDKFLLCFTWHLDSSPCCITDFWSSLIFKCWFFTAFWGSFWVLLLRCLRFFADELPPRWVGIASIRTGQLAMSQNGLHIYRKMWWLYSLIMKPNLYNHIWGYIYINYIYVSTVINYIVTPYG